jgi:hypothetical protein
LQGKILSRKCALNIRQRFLRIDRHQRLEAILDVCNNATARLDLIAKELQVFFRHKRHVDSKREQMLSAHPRQ